MHLFLIIFLFGKIPRDTLHLAADLKKDSIICSEQHGGYLDHPKKYDWGAFAKYAYLDLAKFKFQIENKQELSIKIKKWTNKWAKLVIREIDTTLEINCAEKNEPPRIGKLRFHIYIIDPYKEKRLVYLSEHNEGLCEYRIGKDAVESKFEDIPIGFDCPKLDFILKLIPVKKAYDHKCHSERK